MREVVLEAASMLAPAVRLLRFAVVDGEPFTCVAGQWVNLWLETSAGRQKRAYSITGLAQGAANRHFEIAVTRVEDGIASPALHGLPIGARIEVDGPHGMFTRQGQLDRPALFIGTGTGVCPLRAMIQEALTVTTSTPPLTLLFGCRYRQDILFREAFEAAARSHGNFRYHVTLSRPDAQWDGLSGYVQEHLRSCLDGDEEDRPHVYVCGLTPMVSAVRTKLKAELGYDRRWIHSERYD